MAWIDLVRADDVGVVLEEYHFLGGPREES
jgi:hypothetical protein